MKTWQTLKIYTVNDDIFAPSNFAIWPFETNLFRVVFDLRRFIDKTIRYWTCSPCVKFVWMAKREKIKRNEYFSFSSVLQYLHVPDHVSDHVTRYDIVTLTPVWWLHTAAHSPRFSACWIISPTFNQNENKNVYGTLTNSNTYACVLTSKEDNSDRNIASVTSGSGLANHLNLYDSFRLFNINFKTHSLF